MPNPNTETATEDRADAELAELLAEYYRLAEPEMERGGDFLWQLSERLESGRRVGWFVEQKATSGNSTRSAKTDPTRLARRPCGG